MINSVATLSRWVFVQKTFLFTPCKSKMNFSAQIFCVENFSAQHILCGKFFHTNYYDPLLKTKLFSARTFTSKTKHFPCQFLDVFEPRHILKHQFWLLVYQTIQNIDICVCGKFFRTKKTVTHIMTKTKTNTKTKTEKVPKRMGSCIQV